MTLSLSTMWAQQERFVADMHAFVHEARALGYDAIEVAHSLALEPFERLLSHHDVAISSVHAPAPLVRDATHERANSSLNLLAEEAAEREAAVAYTKKSIDLAKDAGGRFVVVHFGGVGSKMFDEELRMRRLFDSGTREGAEVDELRAVCFAKREGLAPPYIERGHEVLRELAAHAESREIGLGLENRLHYHEIPLPAECAELIAPYHEELVGYWHDVGHAEVQARLGFTDKRLWLDTNGPRTLGAHLHDVDGIGDHRAPGNGDVEWDYIANGLPARALRVFEINQHQPAEAVAASIEFLRARGVIV